MSGAGRRPGAPYLPDGRAFCRRAGAGGAGKSLISLERKSGIPPAIRCAQEGKAMWTELPTIVFVLGLPILLLTEEIARLLPVRAKVERRLPSRRPARATASNRRAERAA
jgi:hypothetical protein